jgi:hypothetical protein
MYNNTAALELTLNAVHKGVLQTRFSEPLR